MSFFVKWILKTNKKKTEVLVGMIIFLSKDSWHLALNMSQSENLQSSSSSRQFLKVTATPAFLPHSCICIFKTLWATEENCIWGSSNLKCRVMTHMLEGSYSQDGIECIMNGYFPSGDTACGNTREDLWPVWIEVRCGLSEISIASFGHSHSNESQVSHCLSLNPLTHYLSA